MESEESAGPSNQPDFIVKLYTILQNEIGKGLFAEGGKIAVYDEFEEDEQPRPRPRVPSITEEEVL